MTHYLPIAFIKHCYMKGSQPDQKSPIMTWLEMSPYGDYRCLDCWYKGAPDQNSRWMEKDNEKRYVLNSVSLLPLYIGTDIFPEDEIRDIIRPGVELFERTGLIPSNLEGTCSLGYDYGLMLYNMVKLNIPLKEKVLGKMLDILDPTGAWVEYYDNDVPYSCRTRPWESAINIEAVVEYIKSL
jgi:hypothetical protein